MNPYGILTSYEERMKANLQRYQRPEKARTFRLRLDHRTWGKHMCLLCYTRLKIIYSAFWLRVLLHLAIEKGPPL